MNKADYIGAGLFAGDKPENIESGDSVVILTQAEYEAREEIGLTRLWATLWSELQQLPTHTGAEGRYVSIEVREPHDGGITIGCGYRKSDGNRRDFRFRLSHHEVTHSQLTLTNAIRTATRRCREEIRAS